MFVPRNLYERRIEDVIRLRGISVLKLVQLSFSYLKHFPENLHTQKNHQKMAYVRGESKKFVDILNNFYN